MLANVGIRDNNIVMSYGSELKISFCPKSGIENDEWLKDGMLIWEVLPFNLKSRLPLTISLDTSPASHLRQEGRNRATQLACSRLLPACVAALLLP
ncbi:hypothetical protein SASPL_130621 [Salvia splendens]|uniref:Uncharacterized protein n=1 Tax=Salvia splendens TaxID=180675 RepID=A0A8X8X4J2_SALSN|nr:hypothetical protein SASPL_130621 [Salvia splendens]